jgi:3-phenylpropionate/trans-cinnamate dioxygenase ferredoxin reductase component
MNETSLLIIGAGHAGVECAAALRSNGFDGAITLLSQESELPYERPPLSKALLAGSTEAARIRLRPEAFYVQNRIALEVNSTVTSLEAENRIARTTRGDWSFTHCVIATGASARSLPLQSDKNVFSIRTIADVQAMRDELKAGCRLLVVGGGYLGLEAAYTAAHLGARVTVVEQGTSIMPARVSAATASRLHALHLEHGVKICTNSTILNWERLDGIWRATTMGGEVHDADVVLLAIGARPNTGIAEAAGIACDGGILVHEDCRTSAPGIFAIGDCAAGLRSDVGRHLRVESVNNALVQGRIVAAIVSGKATAPWRPPTFWSEQCGKRLQMAGLITPDLDCDDVFKPTARGWLVERFQAGILQAIEAVDSPVEFMQGVKRIGSTRPLA